VSFTLDNRGRYDGAEVLQLYVAGRCCDVVRPLKELKGYCRLNVPAGQSADGAITLEENAFCYYDRDLRCGLHDGDYDLLLGTSSEDILHTFSVRVRGGKIEPAAPCAE
jgi:beta-glucosidase